MSLRQASAAPAAGHMFRDDAITAALVERIRATRLVVFDFDGVFTDNAVLVGEDGREYVRCWRGDGLGLRQLEQLGMSLLILSTEQNTVVSARGRKLRIDCIQGCDDKLAQLRETVAARGVTLAETAFVGNDINDADCLRAVGLPVVVGDAHPDVAALGLYRTRTPGGYGAVREVCDLIVYVRTART